MSSDEDTQPLQIVTSAKSRELEALALEALEIDRELPGAAPPPVSPEPKSPSTRALDPLPAGFGIPHDDPLDVRIELPGWSLYWALLEPLDDASDLLAGVRESAVARARARYRLDTLAGIDTVAALRLLFRAAGTDPTRYRPSSEALLRRVLKGGSLPAISPLVDLNNCLSLDLAAPCCVMDVRTVSEPFLMRAGAAGEAYTSLRGPFRLEGRPTLVDAYGPCDAPIMGSERVKVTDTTRQAWLVAYLPSTVSFNAADAALRSLLSDAPVARVMRVSRHAWIVPPASQAPAES